MVTALFATITGLAGIILGRVWDSRLEAARWRRDQKVGSYQRLAEAFRRTYEAIRTIAILDPDDSRAAVSAAREDHSWDDALASVWLHGSPAVVTAAVMMDRAITDLLYTAQERLFSVADWEKARIPSRRALEHFIKTARDELGLSPVSIGFFPESAGA
jgi:hypothetical protein